MIRSEASGFQMQDLSSASSTAMQLISTPGKGGSMSRHSLSRTSRALSSLTSWQSALTPDQSRTRGATSQAYTKHVLPGDGEADPVQGGRAPQPCFALSKKRKQRHWRLGIGPVSNLRHGQRGCKRKRRSGYKGECCGYAGLMCQAASFF